MNDNHSLTSSQIYEWLTHLMYARRSKFDPLWLGMLVGGFESGLPYVSFLLYFLLNAQL